MHTIQERCAVSRKLCNTVWFCLHSITLQLLFTCTIKAQYTPPTPTQLNCRVELRRRCVLNSQLVGDGLDESEQFADNEVELRRVGRVNAAMTQPSPVVTQLLLGLLHWLQNCKLGHDSQRARTHRRHNSTRQDKFSTCSVSKFSSAVVVS